MAWGRRVEVPREVLGDLYCMEANSMQSVPTEGESVLPSH